jgi:peroxin-7
VFGCIDGLFDVAWSEENENHLVSASADGTIKLWDIKIAQKPLRSFDEHTAEVASVDWNPHVRNQ